MAAAAAAGWARLVVEGKLMCGSLRAAASQARLFTLSRLKEEGQGLEKVSGHKLAGGAAFRRGPAGCAGRPPPSRHLRPVFTMNYIMQILKVLKKRASEARWASSCTNFSE